ncbi:MAG: EAL domain-containing protein [Herminiimonas sp.]|nr:EAL domain-containing protein [Herminiimonas sp.]
MNNLFFIGMAGCAVVLLCATCGVYWHGTALRIRNKLHQAQDRIEGLETLSEDLKSQLVSADASPVPTLTLEGGGHTGKILQVNPAFERLLGFSAVELLSKSYWRLHDAKSGKSDDDDGCNVLRDLLGSAREGSALVCMRHRNGAALWNNVQIARVSDDKGQIAATVLAHHDISDFKRRLGRLEHEANHDALTGLANRTLLRSRLSEAIAAASLRGQKIWIVFIDLDRFKAINDSLGHKAGDHLLQIISERLLGVVRDSDTVARLGGDEFVTILRSSDDHPVSANILGRIIDAVAQPVVLDGHDFAATCSMGISIFPDDGNDPEKLVGFADVAMYSAKEKGRNNYQFYDAALNQRALARMLLEAALRTAVERKEFCLHYQPQIDLKTRHIVGVEALIFWRRPGVGIVPPADFIGIAEETGLINEIGAWVIAEACAQNKAWQDAGLGELRMAVNLSPRQFAQQDLVDSINRTLTQTGLSPHCLEIEITENLIMYDVERAVKILQELKASGIQLSIDDFGTGYSSLSYLKLFPIDVLKIDKSFVHDIGADAGDEAIVLSIISLAHSLKLHVIAEGVETLSQATFLERHGCDEVQGYYFSRPVSPTVLAHMLEEQKIHAASVELAD